MELTTNLKRLYLFLHYEIKVDATTKTLRLRFIVVFNETVTLILTENECHNYYGEK